MSKNVVITGYGLITSKGYEPEKIWNNLFNFRFSGDLDEYCGMVYPADFKKKYIDVTKNSTYGYCAVELAWKRAFKSEEDIDGEKWGVYNGSAFGNFIGKVINACDVYRKEGPTGLLPDVFNNKGCNVTADIIAITHGLKGANTTFMSGRLASGMALLQAFDDVMHEELQGVAVIGTEAVDEYIVKGHKIVGEENTDLFSSGAGSLIVQGLEDINVEITMPLGYIRAVETAAYGREFGYYSDKLSDGLIKAINLAIQNADICPNDIDVILSGQGKSQTEAENYQKAYTKVFGEKFESKVVNSKSLLGDSLGAFPVINTALGLMILEKQAMPSKGGFKDMDIKYALITADDPCGNAWALVLERYTKI